MDSPQKQQVKELLADALDVEPADRSAFLDRECDDPVVRDEVQRLLIASEGGDDLFVEVPKWALFGDLRGEVVGSYRLERFLGRGGMGAVYLGERADGEFSHAVAIKLMPFVQADEDSLRRFRVERETLARLQHPNIARLFDGGLEKGMPYFVMEYVHGPRIDRFCDDAHLPVEDRLRHFMQVAEAVAYAHSQGVIHRDIKPANVLVADGRARLLDFGIAKWIRDAAPELQAQTASGSTPMTPAYASPEQVSGAAVAETTDVYSLGVMLYELLCGLSPYEHTPDSAIGFAREVVDGEVLPPSTRLHASQDVSSTELEELAQARTTSIAGLARRLRGDLDTIVLKALEKDPVRRYATVDDLLEDLQRSLSGLPIQARRAGPLNRAVRLVRRHRSASIAGGIALLLAALLIASTFWFERSRIEQEERIASEEGRSEVLLGELTQLYEAADPASAPGERVAARGMLDQAVRSLKESTAHDPATRASLLLVAGQVYGRLGSATEALPLLEESLQLRRELFDPPHEELAETLFDAGLLTARTAQRERGLDYLVEALEMERALHGDDHVHVAAVRFEIGAAHHDGGNWALAEPHFTAAVSTYLAQPDELTAELSDRYATLADVLAVTGQIDKAIELLERAHAIDRELFGPEHPRVARTFKSLGLLYYNARDRQEGIDLLHDAVRILRRAYGPEGHPMLGDALHNLGAVLSAEGDPAGVDMTRQSVEVYRSLSSTNPATLAASLGAYGNALRDHGSPEDAIAAYEESVQVSEEGGVQPLFSTGAKLQLAGLLERDGPSERAAALYEQVLAAYEAVFPPEHPRIADVRGRLERARAGG